MGYKKNLKQEQNNDVVYIYVIIQKTRQLYQWWHKSHFESFGLDNSSKELQ